MSRRSHLILGKVTLKTASYPPARREAGGERSQRRMVAEKAFEHRIEAPAPNRDAGTSRDGSPRGTEAHAKPGSPQMPREPLHEDGRGRRRSREADGAGLEHGFGESGVLGHKA